MAKKNGLTQELNKKQELVRQKQADILSALARGGSRAYNAVRPVVNSTVRGTARTLNAGNQLFHTGMGAVGGYSLPYIANSGGARDLTRDTPLDAPRQFLADAPPLALAVAGASGPLARAGLARTRTLPNGQTANALTGVRRLAPNVLNLTSRGLSSLPVVGGGIWLHGEGHGRDNAIQNFEDVAQQAAHGDPTALATIMHPSSPWRHLMQPNNNTGQRPSSPQLPSSSPQGSNPQTGDLAPWPRRRLEDYLTRNSPTPSRDPVPALSGIPNWGRMLGLGGLALTGGALAHSMTGEEEDEHGQKRKRMPWLAPLLGLGGAAAGTHLLTGGDWSKLTDSNWWQNKNASYLNAKLILMPYQAKYAGIFDGVNTAFNSVTSPTMPEQPPMPRALEYPQTPQNFANITGTVGTNPIGAAASTLANSQPQGAQPPQQPTSTPQITPNTAASTVGQAFNPLGAASSLEARTTSNQPQGLIPTYNRQVGGVNVTQAASLIGGLGQSAVAPNVGGAASAMPQVKIQDAVRAITADAPKMEGIIERTLVAHPELLNPNGTINQQALDRTGIQHLTQEFGHTLANDRNPESPTQAQPGIMARMVDFWHGLPMWAKILVGIGISLTAVSLLGSMMGGGGGGGMGAMGMMGPLLAIGGLGLGAWHSGALSGMIGGGGGVQRRNNSNNNNTSVQGGPGGPPSTNPNQPPYYSAAQPLNDQQIQNLNTQYAGLVSNGQNAPQLQQSFNNMPMTHQAAVLNQLDNASFGNPHFMISEEARNNINRGVDLPQHQENPQEQQTQRNTYLSAEVLRNQHARTLTSHILNPQYSQQVVNYLNNSNDTRTLGAINQQIAAELRSQGRNSNLNAQQLQTLTQTQQDLRQRQLQLIASQPLAGSNLLAFHDLLNDSTITPQQRTAFLQHLPPERQAEFQRVMEMDILRRNNDIGLLSSAGGVQALATNDPNARNAVIRLMTYNFNGRPGERPTQSLQDFNNVLSNAAQGRIANLNPNGVNLLRYGLASAGMMGHDFNSEQSMSMSNDALAAMARTLHSSGVMEEVNARVKHNAAPINERLQRESTQPRFINTPNDAQAYFVPSGVVTRDLTRAQRGFQSNMVGRIQQQLPQEQDIHNYSVINGQQGFQAALTYAHNHANGQVAVPQLSSWTDQALNDTARQISRYTQQISSASPAELATLNVTNRGARIFALDNLRSHIENEAGYRSARNHNQRAQGNLENLAPWPRARLEEAQNANNPFLGTGRIRDTGLAPEPPAAGSTEAINARIPEIRTLIRNDPSAAITQLSQEFSRAYDSGNADQRRGIENLHWALDSPNAASPQTILNRLHASGYRSATLQDVNFMRANFGAIFGNIPQTMPDL